MEVDLRDTKSQSFEKSYISTLFGKLEDAVEDAAELRDIELVQNPELRKAISIVEDFLRDKKRLCYGGMAINAHLPPSHKFYDLRKVLPDYDFFTPTAEEDAKELVAKLNQYKFDNVSMRLGMHEGTYKVFVNYHGVADLTQVPYWFFKILDKRAIIDDGIHYVDSDFLRMGMYLELSRPRGEVERWDKVYKRLLLLNLTNPPKDVCHKKGHRLNHIGRDIHNAMIRYIQDNSFIYIGADLKKVYAQSGTTKAGFILKTASPVMAYCEAPEYHLPIIRQILHDLEPSANFHSLFWDAEQDMFPEMYGLTKNGKLCLLLLRSQFCHGYNTVKLNIKDTLKVASLDTAITLFYQLSYLRGLEGIVPNSVYCFATELVKLSIHTRDKGRGGVYSLFSTTCSGHQPTKQSLLAAKARRVASFKRKKVKSKSLTKKRRI